MTFEAGRKTESGYLALPPSGGGPGVLVLHAWWGLNDFFVGLCDRLAGEGFVALAPDLFEGKVATTITEAENLRDAHDAGAEAAEGKVFHALQYLAQHPAVQGNDVGVMGFSLGAWWALQTATWQPEAVAAVVLFYGVGEADYVPSRAAYQGHFAENDTFEPLEQVRQMETDLRTAGKEVTFYVYPGVGHWFFEENQPAAFDATSAQQAWDRTVPFLHSQLK